MATTVKVSPKFQLLIPLEIRRSLGLRPGEKVQVFEFDGRIEFIPVRKMRELRGFLKGIDVTVSRDDDRI